LQVFDIFAKNNMEKFVERYENTLKNELSEASRSFWDSKIVGPAGAKRCKIKTFMYSGTSGWTAYVTFRIFFPLVGLGWLRKAMMDGEVAPSASIVIGTTAVRVPGRGWFCLALTQ
jgi:hypothetical protein